MSNLTPRPMATRPEEPKAGAASAGLERLLDLLADQVAARLQVRSQDQPPLAAPDRGPVEPLDVPERGQAGPATAAGEPPAGQSYGTGSLAAGLEPGPEPHLTSGLTGAAGSLPGLMSPPDMAAGAKVSAGPGDGPVADMADARPPDEAWPEPGPILIPGREPVAGARASHAAGLLARLALGLLVLVVAINVPFNGHGTTLATALPGSASLVIRNGLVVKEADKPEFWVYRNDSFHWISSLDAFNHYGYRWQDVHVVEPGFLRHFTIGAPVHVLLKCPASPHIYRLENDQKRWIVDLATFQAEGHVWDDVEIVSCDYLRNLPAGDSIPPGRGTPPPPLP